MNQAKPSDIAAHLSQCDAHFVPPLSGRTNIGDYARKIAGQAATFEAWSDGMLVGLVAAYCNDQGTRIAYVTNMSVMQEWMGRGIAERLLRECLAHAAAVRMRQVRLEVSKDNVPAIKLYKKLGFAAVGVADAANGANEEWVGMILDLEKRGSE